MQVRHLLEIESFVEELKKVEKKDKLKLIIDELQDISEKELDVPLTDLLLLLIYLKLKK